MPWIVKGEVKMLMMTKVTGMTKEIGAMRVMRVTKTIGVIIVDSKHKLLL
jgi:hypothetical protein